MVKETTGKEFEAVLARSLAAKMAALTGLARAFGQPDPFVTDADRVLRRKVEAVPPVSCGPEIIAAPARGATICFAPIAVTPKGSEDFEITHAGYRGRDAVRRADAFDKMTRAATRKRGQGASALFTKGQVAAGRRYAELVERHASVGMRCASVEARSAASGGGDGLGGYVDAVIDGGRQIARIEAQIGAGVALAPRWAKAGDRVASDRVISDLDLVQMVCLRDMTIAEVLRARGWSPDAKTRGRLYAALRAALDRMG